MAGSTTSPSRGHPGTHACSVAGWQRLWMRALRRRSQRNRFDWKRMERMTKILWPRITIRPPMARPAVCRQAPEVGAGWINVHVRICAGGAQQCAFLPRLGGRARATTLPTRPRQTRHRGRTFPACPHRARPVDRPVEGMWKTRIGITGNRRKSPDPALIQNMDAFHAVVALPGSRRGWSPPGLEDRAGFRVILKYHQHNDTGGTCRLRRSEGPAILPASSWLTIPVLNLWQYVFIQSIWKVLKKQLVLVLAFR